MKSEPQTYEQAIANALGRYLEDGEGNLTVDRVQEKVETIRHMFRHYNVRVFEIKKPPLASPPTDPHASPKA